MLKYCSFEPMCATQLELPGISPAPVLDAVDFFSESEAASRGEVFTRQEIANFILDLCGWSSERELRHLRLLEPSCGAGDFLMPAIKRLLESCVKPSAEELGDCIVGVEVNRTAFETCHTRVRNLLNEFGFSKNEADWLCENWLHHADFLTLPLEPTFTQVVGNPPYLRQEALPDELLSLYRSRFSTMYDRADLYVPFFEKSLELLASEGCHGFICSDRWMKNRYGGPLRELVSEKFHLDVYVDFTGEDAFHSDVVAYPAVTIIRRGKGDQTFSSIRPEVSERSLLSLSTRISDKKISSRVISVSNVSSGAEPWLLENLPLVSELRKLEKTFPSIEEAGCKVGIGVATGADKIYINRNSELDIEDELKLPILTTRDVVDGKISWSDRYVVNPFKGDSCELVDPDRYPKFKKFLEVNRDGIRRRHVAKKNPKCWFKTIDRIYPKLTATPKLLIPDIKGEAEVILDDGQFYPHHNFYYITSKKWDLHALQAVMLSPIAKAFVATYSLKMRGDCFRFQAQYLRRIRLPEWHEVAKEAQDRLIDEAKAGNRDACNSTIRKIYGISQKEWRVFESI